jgi:predicted ATPase/signal transduction histidine kinase
MSPRTPCRCTGTWAMHHVGLAFVELLMMVSLPGYVTTKLLRESARARVYEVRRKRDALRLIAKVYDISEPGSEARVEHEFRVLEGLDFPGVVRVRGVERVGRSLVLLLDHVDGQNLQEFADGAALPVERVLKVAMELSATLAKIHARRVIHRDIKPSNILIEAESGRAILADFGISVLLEQDRQYLYEPSMIEGTLPYISPEQTGRTQREVDVRSDLYSLGVTLYELLTGERPFTGKAPLELVHAHLAQQPKPPHQRVAHIPRSLSAIVVKLLAKAPEHRYQSAQGLLADLERLAVARASGELEPDFTLGEHDFAATLQLPHQLHGRERELLATELAEVVALGESRFLLVTGSAGSGKTSLVRELEAELSGHGGYFGYGQFEQLGDEAHERADAQPYRGSLRPMRAVFEQILTESDERLASWRRCLRTALGPLAGVIAPLVPELALVVGALEPVPAVEPGEARNRLHLALVRLLSALAEHAPLVLVFDALQWIDAASRELLDAVVLDGEVRGPVLFIGVCRSESTRDIESFMRPHVRVIEREPLPDAALAQLLADALRRSVDEVAPLAAIIGRKTSNNPMFVRQMLVQLADLDLLRRGDRGWEWDLDAIASLAIPNDLLEMMRAKLERLPSREQMLIALAACIGARFELELLAAITELPGDELAASLYALESAGLITHVGLTHQFAHDRIQAAARERLDVDTRRRIHRRLGFELLARTGTEPPTDERLFEIVDQLDQSLAIRNDDAGSLTVDERDRFAKLNLDAGERALRSAAWRAARGYFEFATRLLAERRGGAGFAALFGLAQTLALANETEAADAAFTELLGWPISLVERSEVVARRINILRLHEQHRLAVDTAREGLAACGIQLSAKISRAQVLIELIRAWRTVMRLELDDFLRMPDASDERAIAAMHIINAVKISAFQVDPSLYMFLIALHVRLLMRAGYHPTAPEGLAQLSLARLAIQRPRDAARLVAVAVELSRQRRCSPAVAVTTEVIHVMYVGPTARPFIEFMVPLERLQQRALECGERTLAGFLGMAHLFMRFETGAHLGELLELEARTQQTNLDLEEHSLSLASASLRWVAKALAAEEGENDREHEDTGRSLAELLGGSKVNRLVRYMAAGPMALAYLLLGQHERAEEIMGSLAADYDRSLIGMYAVPRHAMIEVVIASQTIRTDPSKRRSLLRRIRNRLALLQRYSEVCPENYLASLELARAELAWLSGHPHEAWVAFERARALATDHNLVYIEALASQRLVALAAAERWPIALDGALRATRVTLQRWGAWGAARRHELRHATQPAVIEGLRDLSTESRSGEFGLSGTQLSSGSVSSLDFASVLGAVQVISEDLRLEEVITRVLTRAIENAGADRGLLLLERTGTVAVVAEGDIEAAHAQLEHPLALRDAGEFLPSSVVNFVVRTGEAVVVDDARADPRFASDPYIASAGVRSILCMPIIKHAEQVGALVLENRSSAGVFTHKRLATLELLLGQAASALENARLYAQLQRSEAQWRSLVDGVPDLIMLVDAHGQVEFVNRADAIGKPEEDLRGQQAAALFDNDSGVAWDEALAAVVATGAVRELELGLGLADAQRRWLATRICPIVLADHGGGTAKGGECSEQDGKAERYLAIATDVTARKALEAQVRQQQRLESVGTLAAGVAHEINNPIQGIMNYAELIQEFPRDVDSVIEYTGEIVHEAGRVTTIVRSLLAFARKDLEQEFEPREIMELIDDTLALIRTVLRKDQIALEVERPAPLPKVRCRGPQIQQIIMNLVINARDALNQHYPGHDPRKRIEIRATEIDRDDATWVRVSVKDNGGGIPEHLRASIFDPFFTTKGRGQGTGLGLALSHKIADDHGGRIWVESEVGIGAEFHLELPVGA